MAGKSLLFQQQYLDLVFLGTALDISAGSYPDWYIALHTSDPDVVGNPTSLQSYAEVAYGGYARVAVARNAAGWTRVPSSNVVYPTAAIVFPTAVSGSVTATHWSIGRDAAGDGFFYYSGPLAMPIAISALGTPAIASQNTSITEE